MTVYNPLANYKYLTICKEFWPSQNQRDRKCHSNIGRRLQALAVRPLLYSPLVSKTCPGSGRSSVRTTLNIWDAHMISQWFYLTLAVP